MRDSMKKRKKWIEIDEGNATRRRETQGRTESRMRYMRKCMTRCRRWTGPRTESRLDAKVERDAEDRSSFLPRTMRSPTAQGIHGMGMS